MLQQPGPLSPEYTTCSSAAERLTPSQEARVRVTARAHGDGDDLEPPSTEWGSPGGARPLVLL